MATPENFFTPLPNQKTETEAENKHNFFKVVDENAEPGIPESVEEDPWISLENNLMKPHPRRNRGFKWLIVTLLLVLTAMTAWDIANFTQMLWQQSKLLGAGFSVLVLLLLGLVMQQLLLMHRNQKQLQRADHIRETASRLMNGQHHGQGKEWLHTLKTFYLNQPQETLLTPCIDHLPDYLNDQEIVNRISEEFYQQLDRQAISIIERTSINSAALIAVSQLAVIDTLLVIWKTLNMINQINQIYGVRLNHFSQWRLNFRIAKIALSSYASQAGISFISEQAGIGLGGKVLGSVAQGFGVGLYQARIGISAMQQIRPVAFQTHEKPKLNMFANLLKRKLSKFAAETD